MTFVNGVEATLFVGALWLSRAKMVPAILLIYAFMCYFMGSYFDLQYEKLWEDYIFDNISEKVHTESVALMYLVRGVVIAWFAIMVQMLTLFRWANVKAIWITALFILLQSLLSIFMYACVKYDVDFNWVLYVYSTIDKKFVIIYVVIAWMTVYFSRRDLN
ncbi:MAG: hypothetical protein GY782_11835 [Gammaproteobacteria bacterium]|nr:hypothetical protein [Gammaproteobacteria bacterium]